MKDLLNYCFAVLILSLLTLLVFWILSFSPVQVETKPPVGMMATYHPPKPSMLEMEPGSYGKDGAK